MAQQQQLKGATLRRLVNELTKLQTSPPEGISITVNEDTLSELTAIIEGPDGTPYANGKFHVCLTIDSSFPNTPPKGTFITKIFHPNVSEQGEICVNTLKKDWQKSYGIEHVLVTVKCLLIYPNPESALNEEAGKLLLEHYEDYAKHAKMMTEIHAMPRSNAGTESLVEIVEPVAVEPAKKKRKRTMTARERSKWNLRRF